MTTDERWSGTIKVGWTIRDRDLGPQSDGEPTPAEMRAIYDRIEDLVTQAFHQRVTIWIDGEDKPSVDVFLEADSNEIEIDEGADIGMLSDLRNALEDGSDREGDS
jgi:hypothetical protein